MLFAAADLCAQEADPLAGYPAVMPDEVVAAVRQAGPAVKAAELTLDAAQAALIQAKAQQGLTVGESAGYTRQQGSGTDAASGNVLAGGVSVAGPQTSVVVSGLQSPTVSGSSTTLSVSGSQVLWDGYAGGTPSGQTRVAQDNYRVAEAARSQAVSEAVLAAQQAYYTLLADQKTLLVRQATLKQAAENLSREQGLQAAQRATDLDVLQMRVASRQAELDLKSTLAQIDADRKTLSILAGWPLDKLYVVSEGTAPTPLAASADEAVTAALSARPELRTLAAQIDAARITEAIAAAAWSPVVTLNGGVNTSSGNTSTQIATVGVNVALPPLWDGGAASASRRQASDVVAQYLIQQEQQRANITVEVQKDWFAMQDARDRLELAQSNVEQATGQYKMEALKLSVGLETTLDVLTAFTAMTTAQVALEQAKTAAILAVLTFNHALGREESP